MFIPYTSTSTVVGRRLLLPHVYTLYLYFYCGRSQASSSTCFASEGATDLTQQWSVRKTMHTSAHTNTDPCKHYAPWSLWPPQISVNMKHEYTDPCGCAGATPRCLLYFILYTLYCAVATPRCLFSESFRDRIVPRFCE